MNKITSSTQSAILNVPPIMARVRRLFVATAIAAAWLLTTDSTRAQYLETFDSYANGSGMNAQGGWKGWDNVAAVANMATVNNTFASSLPHSVRVVGTAFAGNQYTDLVHEFSGYTSGLWTFSARQYIPSSSTTGTSYFILLNRYADGAANNNWSVQTTFNLATGVVGEDNDTAEIPQTIIRDAWVDLNNDINLTANTVTEYYNGVAFSTRAWQTGGVNAIGAIDLYSDISSQVFYDNIAITAVPEPATATLMLLAALGLAYKRTTRKSC